MCSFPGIGGFFLSSFQFPACLQSPICGFRYLCTRCDVSLCDACEQLGKHAPSHSRYMSQSYEVRRTILGAVGDGVSSFSAR